MFNNNFYPYNYGRTSLFRNIGSQGRSFRFNWSNILNNTQKTLNIINQAIPVMYQIKPIYNNAKTIFKVMGAVKDEPVKTKNTVNERAKNNNSQAKEEKSDTSQTKYNSYDSPVFFL